MFDVFPAIATPIALLWVVPHGRREIPGISKIPGIFLSLFPPSGYGAYEYIRGEIHTNGMENFWSLLKRMLGGSYVAVSPKNLTRYCAEEAFRFNKRKENDSSRFQKAMMNTPGKRLQYKELAAKTDRIPGMAGC